jgi:signal transduction histidine kinase/CheY-like chemotaxis protein/ligand-binding sensor domain-containing protein
MYIYGKFSFILQRDSLIDSIYTMVKSLASNKQRNLHIFLLVLCLGTFPFSNLYSISNVFQFKHLSVNDGLSSSNVRKVFQDQSGYMWFGTENGLSRYDGVNIKIYKNIRSDIYSLLSDYVRTIYEDHNRNLLIGTKDGLTQYDRDLDRFINFRYDNSSAFFGVKCLVRRIVEDTIGNLWLATDSGLVYFDRKNNTVLKYQHDPSNPGTISDNNLEAVYIDGSMRLWIGNRKGLELFKPKTGDFEHILFCKTHNDTIGSIYFLDIIEDREGNIWFGSSDGLFCLENRHGNDNLELTHYKNSPEDEGSLSNNRAKSLFIDNGGKLWIGTENGGLNLLDRKTMKFIHYRVNEFNPMSLNSESIHSIVQDRNENLWLGTWGGGVNLSVKNSDFIIHYKNLPGAPNSLSCNVVSGFMEDRKQRLWITTDGGGFNLLNDKTGRFTRYTSDNLNIKSNAILCIAAGDDNKIWLGTWEGGLVCYNYSDNSIKSFTTQNSTIPENNIFAIAKDAQGNLWIGTFGHGLLYYKINERTCTIYSTENSAISVNKIDLIRLNKNNQVYLGSSKGFQVFLPDKALFSSYANIDDDTNSLSNNNVNDIFIENDTCIWIATQNGLNLFNPISRKMKRIYTEDGLQNKSILGLTKDKFGMLWMTTNAGISRFDYCNNKVNDFVASDGLQGTEFKKASILTTEDGAILAGGTNGFNVIKPEKMPKNMMIPKVVLTDIHIFNKKVDIGSKDSPLKKQISKTKSITLSYKQSVLTFFFAALDFTNPQKNQYAYWMENFDKEWIYCGTRKEATYTNLNPGKYFFHVKGSNNDGVWNETGATLELIITPPWWKTGFARAGFALFIVFIFIGIIYYFKNIIRMQKQIAERDRSKAEAEAAMKSQFMATMSHEIRTPLNHIIGLTSLLLKETDRTKVADFAKKTLQSGKALQSIVNNILDFSKIESGKVKLEEQPFLLHELLESQSEMFASQAMDKGIALEFLVEDEVPITLNGDALRLNQVLTNLISNAIKFTDKGEVVVSVAQKKRNDTSVYLRFCISDTGIGLDAAQINRLFSAFSQADAATTRKYGGTGLGLIICKRLIELMRGNITVESMPGKGSNFIFEAFFGALPIPDSGSLCFHDNCKNMRVLVVDDNMPMRLLLKKNIEKMGLGVDEATNGNEAIEKIDLSSARTMPYACIIIDYSMPQMDGIAVVKKIRANPATLSLPVIVMTLFGQHPVQLSARKAGANAVLSKPVKKAQLFSALGEALKIFPSASTLPKSITADASQPADDRMLHGATILLAEDNELNVEITKTILQDAGAVVAVAENGLVACRLAGEQPPDAILMDIHMPEMDGIEASRKIHEIPVLKGIPIIAFTASVSAEERARCLSAGICDYVTKPVDPVVLIKTLKTWISPA